MLHYIFFFSPLPLFYFSFFFIPIGPYHSSSHHVHSIHSLCARLIVTKSDLGTKNPSVVHYFFFPFFCVSEQGLHMSHFLSLVITSNICLVKFVCLHGSLHTTFVLSSLYTIISFVSFINRGTVCIIARARNMSLWNYRMYVTATKSLFRKRIQPTYI